MQHCLGIESTAHTFGAAVVSYKGDILSNERAVFKNQTGMIPREVAQHHEKVASAVLKAALKELPEISLVSFSAGPGLAPCLRVGMRIAKEIAQRNSCKMVGVNHCVAHLTIGQLVCKMKHPVFLYVSGANTQVICRGGDFFRIVGETLDIGLGNALDKFGRFAGLGFPAGPAIEKLAKEGKYVSLPYSVKGMDVSFSGLITKAQSLLKTERMADICFSLQETCFAMLAEVAERALAHAQKNELLLIGGVGANKRLCNMLESMCKQRSSRFAAAPIDLAGDQGAMIAWQGVLQKDQATDPEEQDIRPRERTDQIRVTWH